MSANVNRVVITITGDSRGVSAAVRGATREIDLLERHCERANQRIRDIGHGLTDLGQVLSYGFTLPIAAAGAAAFKSAVEMDSLRRGLIAVSGSAGEAEKQLVRLREVAKLPGLGFREAVEGSVKLQAAGMAAREAERALMGFGNAIATVGKGRVELARVNEQLAQMVAKNKVQAQEIRIISEQVPQMRQAMLAAFQTADTVAIQKSGISARDFLAGVLTELEKLPKVTSGIKNSIENFGDAVFVAFSKIGEAMVGPAGVILDYLTPAVERLAERFQQLSPNMQLAIFAALAFTAALGPLVIALGQATLAFTAINALGGPTVGMFAAITAAAGLFVVAYAGNFLYLRDLTNGLAEALAAVFSFLTNNTGSIIALTVAFGALTAAVIAYRAAAVAAAAAQLFASFSALLPVLQGVIAFFGAMFTAVQALAVSLFQLGSVAALTATELAMATAGISVLLGLIAAVGLAWYNSGRQGQQFADVTAEQIEKSAQARDSYAKQIDFLNTLQGGVARNKEEQDRYAAILGQLTEQQRANIELTVAQADANSRHEAQTRALAAELEKLRGVEQKELEAKAASAAFGAVQAVQALEAERQKRQQLIEVNTKLAALRERMGRGESVGGIEFERLGRALRDIGQGDIGRIVAGISNIGATRSQIANLEQAMGQMAGAVASLNKPLDDAEKSTAEWDAKLRAAEQGLGLNTRGVLELMRRLGMFNGDLDAAEKSIARYRQQMGLATEETNKQTDATKQLIDKLKEQRAILEQPALLRRATIDVAVARAVQEAVNTGQKATDVFSRMRKEQAGLNDDITRQQAEEKALREVNEHLQTKGHTARVARTRKEQTEYERLADRVKKLNAEVEGFYDTSGREFKLRYEAEGLERLRRDLEKILDLRRELGLPLDAPLPGRRDAQAIRVAVEQLEAMRRVQQAVAAAQGERLKTEEQLATAILTQGLPIADAETAAQLKLVQAAEERRRKERDLTAALIALSTQRRDALESEAEQARTLREAYAEFRVQALEDEAQSRVERLRAQLRLAINLGRESGVRAEIEQRLRVELERNPAVETPVGQINTNVGLILGVLRSWLSRRDSAAGAAGGLDVGAGYRVAGARPFGFTPGGRFAFGAGRGDHRHEGADVHAPRGTPIGAAGAGRVTFAGPRGDYGNLVVVQHDDGRETRYGHLDRILTTLGARLMRGEELGTLGSTGRSSGPHLHYEVRVNGVPLDPRKVPDLLPLLAGRRVPAGEQAPATTSRAFDLTLPGYAPFTPTSAADFPSLRGAPEADEMTAYINIIRGAIDTLDVITQKEVNEGYRAVADAISGSVENTRRIRREREAEAVIIGQIGEKLYEQILLNEAIELREDSRSKKARAANVERVLLLDDYNNAVNRSADYVLRVLQQSDDERLAQSVETQNNLIVLEDDYRRAVEREAGYVARIREQETERRLSDRVELQNRLIALEDDLAAARVRSNEYVGDRLATLREQRLNDEKKLLDDIFDLEQHLAEGVVNAQERRRLAQLQAVKEVRDADQEAIESQIRSQVRLADATVLHSEQARSAVLEHLARQKTMSDAVAESFTNLYDRAIKPIDAAIDRMTARMGLFGEVVNSVLKSIARQLLNRVFSRLLDAILPPTDGRTAAGAGEGALSEVFDRATGRRGESARGEERPRQVAQMGVAAQTVIIQSGQVVFGEGGAALPFLPGVPPGVGATPPFVPAAGGGRQGGGDILGQLFGGFLNMLGLGGGRQTASAKAEPTAGGGVLTAHELAHALGVGGGQRGAAAAGVGQNVAGLLGGRGGLIDLLGGGGGGRESATPPAVPGARKPGLLSQLFDPKTGALGGLRRFFGQQLPGGGFGGLFAKGSFGFGNSAFASALPLMGMSLGGQFGGPLGMAGGLLASIGLIGPGAVGLSSTSFLAPLFSNPITAVVGGALLVGGIILAKNAARRRDEEARSKILLDSKGQLQEIIRQVNSGRLDPDSAVAQAQQVRSEYMAQVGQLKDSKTRKIAEATVRELDYLINNDLARAVARRRAAADRLAGFVPTFAQGADLRWGIPRYRGGGDSASAADWMRGYGLVDGYYDALDSHIIAVTGREVVLSPRDQAALGLTPQKMRVAGVRGFAQAGAVTEAAAKPRPAGRTGGGTTIIVAIGDKAIASAVAANPDAIVHAVEGDLVREGPSGLLGTIVAGIEEHFG